MDDFEVEHLVALVEERPPLWDKLAEDYKNKSVRNLLWREVCDILLPDFQQLSNREKSELGNAMIKKWTGVKDNYAKYVRRLKEVRQSGEGDKKLKEYYLFKHLLFLNKNGPERIIEEEFKNWVANKHLRRKKSPSTSGLQPPRKKQNVDSIEDEVTSYQPEPENRHLCFFKAILPSLNKLNDHQTLIFQSRVLQTLTELHETSHHVNEEIKIESDVDPL